MSRDSLPVYQRTVKMDDLDLGLLMFLEDQTSAMEDSEHRKISDIFRNLETGAYEISVCRHLNCNEKM